MSWLAVWDGASSLAVAWRCLYDVVLGWHLERCLLTAIGPVIVFSTGEGTETGLKRRTYKETSL